MEEGDSSTYVHSHQELFVLYSKSVLERADDYAESALTA